MLHPKYPTTTAPAPYVLTPTAIDTAHTPATPAGPVSCGCHHTPAAPAPAPAPAAASVVRLTPGSVAALVAGGTAAVLIVGTVLVSLLLAVAITAASLTVCALVIRSLLNGQHQR